MKKVIFSVLAAALMMVGCQQKKAETVSEEPQAQQESVVYMTSEVSPEALIRVFDALGVKPEGRVAVKISTGESGGNHYLHPELIDPFVQHVGGKLVECNTAYPGSRIDFEHHRRTIEEHGFNTIGGVDLMDEEGELRIPVRDNPFMQYNIVGSHLDNYDWMINLAHFKGHAMGGFGGVLKNASIGVASTAGKLYIHTAGKYEDASKVGEAWAYVDSAVRQDDFLECMAVAATAVHDYMKGQVLYVAVMNNISIDCDCDSHPSAPEMKDMGIVASTDPVALDQACYDLVYGHQDTEGDDASSLRARIDKQHGIHTVEYAAELGLGSRTYKLVSID